MNNERREKAIAWLTEEIRSLERAPELNGCSMTPEWAAQLEIMRTCLEAVSDYHRDNISIAEDAESEQETLQRAVDEYKARAEKAEHDMKRIVNRSSYPCEYCTKGKCFSSNTKRKCYDFVWDSGNKNIN